MRVTPNGRGLGWRPQKPDHRDAIYMYGPRLEKPLPPAIDLRPFDVPIWDQGHLGSCTGHGSCALLAFARKKSGLQDPAPPSRLMAYYLARELENDVPWDVGAEVRDAIKGLVQTGVCFEDVWPYDPSKFAQKPPQNCYDAAAKDHALVYRPVGQIAQLIRACLAEGYPIVFGFTCYPELDSDEVAKTGLLPMPQPQAQPIGGHCVALYGYDDSSRYYIVRNSWGTEWGDKGYFYMPYEYAQRADLSSDFWMIETVG